MAKLYLLATLLSAFLVSATASPAAHIQKNLATIIGSNVEVNIDVPSEIAVLSDKTEGQHIILNVQSRVDADGANESVEKLEKLIGQEGNAGEGTEVISSEVWKNYAKKGWKSAEDGTEVDVATEQPQPPASGNSSLVNILELVGQIAQYLVQIVVSYLSGDYINILTNLFKIIEKLVAYFLRI